MDIEAQHALRSALDESRENAIWQLSRLRKNGVAIPPWLAQVASVLKDAHGAGTPQTGSNGPTEQSRATRGSTEAALGRFPVPGVTVVPDKH